MEKIFQNPVVMALIGTVLALIAIFVVLKVRKRIKVSALKELYEFMPIEDTAYAVHAQYQLEALSIALRDSKKDVEWYWGALKPFFHNIEGVLELFDKKDQSVDGVINGLKTIKARLKTESEGPLAPKTIPVCDLHGLGNDTDTALMLCRIYEASLKRLANLCRRPPTQN